MFQCCLLTSNWFVFWEFRSCFVLVFCLYYYYSDVILLQLMNIPLQNLSLYYDLHEGILAAFLYVGAAGDVW